MREDSVTEKYNWDTYWMAGHAGRSAKSRNFPRRDAGESKGQRMQTVPQEIW